MKKLYVSGNYVIADNNGTLSEYPLSKSVYTKVETGYLIKETIDSGQLLIQTADIPNWYDESGSVAFSEATLIDFLRTNTGNFKTASGGSGAIGAKVLKTNQTVSYRTGDDGDLQKGREVDFYTLSANNPFGNTNRFTDELDRDWETV